MTKITIILNGEEKSIKNNSKVIDLINELGLDENKIAIERNLEIVQNQEFNEIKLKEQDKIEIVHFIGGG